MPVIDLNDYLGMPQQAPAQPVFRATTQNVDPMALRADNPYSNEAFLANVEARQRLAGLQRLAPVLQAQQAQLAYDKVAEDARLLRQKQEIEAQVQRATDEITQGAIDAESDQFNQQVAGLYTRNPMAFADPRMQQAMSFLGRRADELAQQKQFQAKVDYEARKGLSDAINRAETRFLTGGGSINELNRLRQGSASPDDYISLVEEGAGKLRTTRAKGAGRGAGEPDIIGRYKDLKNEYASRAQKAASDLATFEENAIPKDPGYDQKLAALKKAAEDEQALASQASNAYIASLRSPTGQAAQRPVGPYSPEFLAGYGTAAGQGFIPAAPGLAPAPVGGGAAGKSVVQQPQIPISSLDEQLSRIPVTEQPEFLKRKKAELSESSKVSEEWSRAKKDLESKLKEQFPDKAYEGTNVKPIEQLAMQIVRGEMIRDNDPNAPTDEFGQTAQIPIYEAALRRINLHRFDTAFTEPGKGRLRAFNMLGTQDVNYGELIKDWAIRFLESRNLIQQSPEAAGLTPAQAAKIQSVKQGEIDVREQFKKEVENP